MSPTGVATIEHPAAMYSSVWIGLTKRVESLRAYGNRATSHPARNAGNSSYGRSPK